MPAIDWNSLSSPDDWEAALATLQQAAAAAKAGPRADRQAVEGELANFWTIPCPFTKKIDRARTIYNGLALLDLDQLINATAFAPIAELRAALPARAPTPSEAKLAQTIRQALAALRKQHRQSLAAHLAMAQQIGALEAAVQQLLPQGRKGREKAPKKSSNR